MGTLKGKTGYSDVAPPLPAMAMAVALLMMLITQPSQADFYKWTDESGQVHYSQQPPPDGQKHQTEKLRVDTRTPPPLAEPPTEKDGVKYCGSLILPAKKLNAVTNIAMYRQAIAIWQKYLDENKAKSDAETRQGIADRRCAIAYANRELQALSEVEQGLNTNYERVTSELEELQQQVAQCDERQGEDEAFSVAECKRPHQPRIKELEKMLRGMVRPEPVVQPAE